MYVHSCEKKDESQTNNDGLTLEDCEELLVSVKDQYPNEYKLYDLKSLAVAVAFPRIKALLQNWNMLLFSQLHVRVFTTWKGLLQGDEEVSSGTIPRENE